MKDRINRLPVIDAFKAIAAQLIVLHHLAAYGPLSDAVQQAFPALISWLYDDARMAVQVFLVIGGYLAARTLFSGNGARTMEALGTTVVNRYLRLTVPFLAALALAIASAMVARHWLTDDFIPDAPTWRQLLAHGLLLQSVLDFDALSAGAWYIAIDFQLFLVMLGILWLGSKTTRPSHNIPALITFMAVASLFWFNRNPELDNWAVYFFGAYGLGAAAYWAGQRHSFWLWLLVPLATLALLLDFRPRLAIALSIALLLVVAQHSQRLSQLAEQPTLHYLGKISYALFLVHFPILLLTNTLFVGLELAGPVAGSLGMLATWALSLLVADRFHHWVEQPAARLKAANFAQLWRGQRFQRLRYRLAATAFWVLAIPV